MTKPENSTPQPIDKKKNIILHIGKVPLSVVDSFKRFKEEEREAGDEYQFMMLHDDESSFTLKQKKAFKFFDYIQECDFNDPGSIVKSLQPYQENLAAVTCRSESHVINFAKVVPHVPYLKTPTAQSLRWSVNKLYMRQRFELRDPEITPNYSVAEDLSAETLNKLEDRVGYPMVVKPVGLAQSLLVTNVYHREELKKNLKRIFKQIDKAYRESKKIGERKVLAEELLDGTQYSIDAYVNDVGEIDFCQPVYVKTGKEIGFDDYFGYRQLTPTKLNDDSIANLEEVAQKSIHALGLRNSTAHVEVMRTEEGWKVIEVGPRIGGFRDDMYDLSFDYSHTRNDIYIRLPKDPVINEEEKGYTAAMKFFAEKEGKITSILGIRKAKDLDSFVKYTSSITDIGERARFAKNGGKSIFNIMLHHEDRSVLYADIRRLEKMINIKVE